MPAYTIWVTPALREPELKIQEVKRVLEKYGLHTGLKMKTADCGDEYWAYLTKEVLPDPVINEINSISFVRLKIPEVLANPR